MKSVETRSCAELVDAARTRPSKYHAGSRGTRQPSDNTLASAIRESGLDETLTFSRVYEMVAPSSHGALEGHLCNFLVAMNRYAALWPGEPPARTSVWLRVEPPARPPAPVRRPALTSAAFSQA